MHQLLSSRFSDIYLTEKADVTWSFQKTHKPFEVPGGMREGHRRFGM